MKQFRIKVFDHTKTTGAQWQKTFAACDRYLQDAGVRATWERVRLPRAVPVFDPLGSDGNNNINRDWFRKQYTNQATGYDFAIAFFDERDWLRPYPRNTLRGQSLQAGEIALTGSHTQRATRPISPGKYDTALVTRLLHEMSHDVFDHKVKKPDTTHAWHYDKKNLLGAVREWGYGDADTDTEQTSTFWAILESAKQILLSLQAYLAARRYAPPFPAPSGLREIAARFGDQADPDFEAKHIVRFDFPIPMHYHGKPVKSGRCHRLIKDQILWALNEIGRRGLAGHVRNYGGVYEDRNIRGINAPSTHAWGIAIDIEPGTYPLGSTKRLPAELVEIFAKAGFTYGGDFPGRKDPQHFQYAKNY